jgi:hypothetical protein
MNVILHIPWEPSENRDWTQRFGMLLLVRSSQSMSKASKPEMFSVHLAIYTIVVTYKQIHCKLEKES